MNILVLGSGLLGVSTAYELGRRGFDVTVIERNNESAAEGSYANGAQLSYSHAEPWASPHILPKLPFWILNPTAPLVFSPRFDWYMAKWGIRFLQNCTTTRAEKNCLNILRLGLYSKKQLSRIREETNIDFYFSNKGILRIYSDDKMMEHAKHHSEFQAEHGGTEKILSRSECIELEPSLEHSKCSMAGGIHAFVDEIGDAHTYCTSLAAIAAERYGVKFLYDTEVKEIRTKNNSVMSVITSQGELTADSYVMAMGSYSPIYLRKIGIYTGIYPMKGYSLTIKANEFCPKISVTNCDYKIVYSPIGDELRVAGTAELCGYNDEVNSKRINPIIKASRIILPKADWNQEIQQWACLRPSTPDGPPILGNTPYPNLFLNTGHGTLGWTQAAGSATIVSDLIEGKTPDISLDGLTYR